MHEVVMRVSFPSDMSVSVLSCIQAMPIAVSKSEAAVMAGHQIMPCPDSGEFPMSFFNLGHVNLRMF